MSPFSSRKARDAALHADGGYQEVHPLDWRDDFGPLQYTQFTEFVRHLQAIERASEDVSEEHRLCVQYGYRDIVHFRRVRATFLKYWGEAGDSPTLDEFVWKEPEFSNALMLGMQLDSQDRVRGALASNPNLTAPEEGLTLEQYAGICARVAGTQISPAEMQQLLAPYSLDVPKWERVNRRWVARMQEDASGTITTMFTQAYTAAGAGQYGGAAQAASASLATPGAAPQGPEPMSLEQYAEIAAATGAWTEQGMDVGAMLAQQYRMTSGDLSNVSTYWGQRFTTDLALLDRYSDLLNQATQRFAVPDPDADLVF